MTQEQKAAYVFSQGICALAVLMAMNAENEKNKIEGAPPTYGQHAFTAVPEDYALGHNAVIGLFHGD